MRISKRLWQVLPVVWPQLPQPEGGYSAGLAYGRSPSLCRWRLHHMGAGHLFSADSCSSNHSWHWKCAFWGFLTSFVSCRQITSGWRCFTRISKSLLFARRPRTFHCKMWDANLVSRFIGLCWPLRPVSGLLGGGWYGGVGFGFGWGVVLA